MKHTHARHVHVHTHAHARACCFNSLFPARYPSINLCYASIHRYFLRYKGTYIHINYLLLNAFYLFRYYLGCNTMDSEVMNSNAQRGYNEAGLVDWLCPVSGHREVSARSRRGVILDCLALYIHTYYNRCRSLHVHTRYIPQPQVQVLVPRHRQHKKSVTGIVQTSRIVLPRTITKKITGRKSEICYMYPARVNYELLSSELDSCVYWYWLLCLDVHVFIPRLERCSSILCIW